tara:strand:- start:72 stop:611 length:540 start_codon:yes stop_codon:yes gene_type:complete
MSRIGKSPIRVPDGVNIALNSNRLVVTGPKGSLNLSFSKSLTVTEIEGNLMVDRSTEEKHHKAIHGTTRQLIQNMISGVTIGYKKELELVGVGYQASVQGKRLKLQLGFSHDIFFDVPPSIQVTAERTSIKVEGIDKQLVGIVAAKIRSFRPPEPYKGKGVRYKSEYVRSKQGKTVGAK